MIIITIFQVIVSVKLEDEIIWSELEIDHELSEIPQILLPHHETHNLPTVVYMLFTTRTYIYLAVQ